MVPVSSLITIAICAVIGIAVPILLSWWMVKKYNVKVRTILIGAGVFVLFALVLETILHQVVLKGSIGPTITGNVWYYALYGGLAAGIFEETGRFLAMKFLLKDEPSGAKTAVAYGIGHGGIEMLIIFGFSMVSNLIIASMINLGQADTILSALPADTQAQMQGTFAQFETSTPGTFLTGVWERTSAIILQVGLSVFVWTAVRKGGKWLWLFPAAILIHFLVDASAVLLMDSVSMAMLETIVCAMAVAVGASAVMLAKKL